MGRRHMAQGRKKARPGMFLAVVGCILLLISVVGFFMGKNEVVAIGFLVVGTAVVLFSVFEQRLEGQQQMGPTGLKFNLTAALKKGEEDIEAGRLTSLEELTL